ncbi:hypothetical protein OAJ07_00615 [Gemmatimonadales bacterium]|nr:hypothetical protein [Gemmatimonadales bacterium]
MTLRCVELRSTIVERRKADQPRRQYSFREFRVDMLGKVATLGLLAVALLATLGDFIPMTGTLLVVFGLLWAFAKPIEDVGTRTAVYVLAATLGATGSAAASAMGGGPLEMLGPYVEGLMGNVGTGLAGVAVMTVILQLVNAAKNA